MTDLPAWNNQEFANKNLEQLSISYAQLVSKINELEARVKKLEGGI